MNTFDPRVYIVTDRTAARNRPLALVVEEALQGGATMVQLREKHASNEEIIAIGRQIHTVTQRFGVPLIINDNFEVMDAIGAEGVHLGQEDMPVVMAKSLLDRHSGDPPSGGDSRIRRRFWTSQNDREKHKIIGVSVKTVEQAKKAQRDGADYVGVGPIFATHSKKDAGSPIGISGLKNIVGAVSIPVVAIGGINAENAKEVLQAGASGVAVISAVMGARDPEKATRELYVIVQNFKLCTLNYEV